jgi:hypothetical protein
MPGANCGSPQFGADGLVFFSKQQEDGIGSVIGVEDAGLDERLDQGQRKATLTDEVAPDPPELGRLRWR